MRRAFHRCAGDCTRDLLCAAGRWLDLQHEVIWLGAYGAKLEHVQAQLHADTNDPVIQHGERYPRQLRNCGRIELHLVNIIVERRSVAGGYRQRNSDSGFGLQDSASRLP